MIDRLKHGMTCLVAVGALTACGENEVATAHIREVLAAAGAVPDSAIAASAGAGVDTASLAGDTAGTAAVDTTGPAPVLELPNGDTLHLRPSVVAFYRDRGYQPAWTDDDQILPRGLRMLEAIGQANADGLDRDRYHYSTAHEMARLLEDDAVEERELQYLGNLDLLLTENFARLSRDLVAGTIDPQKAGLDWQIERGESPDRDLIQAVLEGQDPQAVLTSLRPEVPYYDRMVQALRQLRAIEQRGGWGTVPEGESLSEGDRNPRVEALRQRLVAGVDAEEARLARMGAADPQLFDENLQKAVERFQTRHTLHEDGALGPNTLEALNVPVEKRIEALRLNLDRWRWLPNDLGDRYILVNIAGFEMELVENDSTIESMNVVVGETANRTPIFRDTMEHIVVNPYWNVPRSIAEEEILPVARRDPGYLARNNYEMVRENGVTRIRQRPGPSNALGHVKFLFPNDMNIYLHDTPADHLFSQESRAFSHGCIRLERPDDLAKVLLTKLTDYDAADYERLRAADGEQWIPLDEKMPVYILYFTSWIDEDGTIRFHPDIYDRDQSLEQEAEEKLAPVQPRRIAT